MNIYYIASTRIPSERAYGYAMMKLCEEWGRAGHTVKLVVPDRKHGLRDDPFDYYGLEHTFTVEKLPSSDRLGKGQNSRPGFFADLFSFARAIRRIRLPEDAVIYTREYLISFLLPARHLFIEMHTATGNRFLLKRALRRARGVIAISSGVMRSLVQLGIDEKKIFVAHDGADLSAFERAKRDRSVWQTFGIAPEKSIVLYTGHFYEWKGADTLAKAARLLTPDAHVVLMGGVDAELEKFQKEYEAQNVSILPHQPQAKIAGFLKSADVLVLPNSAKAEISRLHASPLKLFEYMASGVPIVASDVPSLREILTTDSAFFFTPDDEASLAQVIRAVLSDHRASERAAASQAEVQKYSWAARAQNISAFLAK